MDGFSRTDFHVQTLTYALTEIPSYGFLLSSLRRGSYLVPIFLNLDQTFLRKWAKM